MGLKEVFVAIESLGVVNVVIPFVMVFIILFAVFEKVKLFKERKVHAVISFIFAFMVVAAADVVRSINLFSYYLVLLIFGAIVLLLFAGVFGGIPDLMNEKRKKYTTVIFIILVFIVVFYGLYASGIKFNLGPVSYEWLQTLVPIIFGILIFVLIVWLITSGGKVAEPSSSTSGAGKGSSAADKDKSTSASKPADKSGKGKDESGDMISVPEYQLKKILDKLSEKEKLN